MSVFQDDETQLDLLDMIAIDETAATHGFDVRGVFVRLDAVTIGKLDRSQRRTRQNRPVLT
jgi:hypothetical protein